MSQMGLVLSAKFFQRETESVARELLGCTLVHMRRGERLAGRIVETEAYLGVIDRAAHTYGGRRTERVRSMYLEGGHAYVYFIYGMHFCLNVVTLTAGTPEAVLIRAIEPLDGVETMRRLRKNPRRDRDIANGPGKLCQALGITASEDGLPLKTASGLFIESGPKVRTELIEAGPRIGVNYAGEAALWPLRFVVKST